MSSSPVVSVINLIMSAGKAAAGPKIASVLGPKGIQMPKFCDLFNKMTGVIDHQRYVIGDPLTARVRIRADKTYDLEVSNCPSVVFLIKKRLSIAKGASNPGKDALVTLDESSVVDIATLKMVDMNADNLGAAVQMVKGTARSMGIEIVG